MMFKKMICFCALLVSMAACGQSGDDNDQLDCGPGQNDQIDGVSVCIIDNELLIETGFNCGPDLELYQGEEVTICADAPLDGDRLEEIEGFAPSQVDDDVNNRPDDANNEPDSPLVLRTDSVTSDTCDEAIDPQSTTEMLTLEDAGEEDDGFEVNIRHQPFVANCCIPFLGAEATIDPDNNTITIEYDHGDADSACNCICAHDLNYKFSGIPAGTWTFHNGDVSAQISLGRP